jgi:hypothetical protein
MGAWHSPCVWLGVTAQAALERNADVHHMNISISLLLYDWMSHEDVCRNSRGVSVQCFISVTGGMQEEVHHSPFVINSFIFPR